MTPAPAPPKKTPHDVTLTSNFPLAPEEIYFPGFQEACQHYPATDFLIFATGYAELCSVDLNGEVVVELACGRGDLAVALARRFPSARIVALDRYPDAGGAIVEAHQRGEVPNLEYRCGDAQDLSHFENASVKLVFGQATLHHLANDTAKLRSETSRILMPGGRLVFLFEPLGHNWMVACVRAIQVARKEMGDESNLFFSTFREIGRSFERVHIDSFNLTGYLLKLFASKHAVPLARLTNRMDRLISRVYPDATKFGANANIFFFK